jgi:DNA polymerase III epsilon subunit-like protein
MSIGTELLRYQKNQLFVDADLETEGLNCIYSRPWQIGYVKFTLDKNIEVVNRYIRWDNLKVSAKAAAITKFDINDYNNKAEDPKKVYEEFEDIVNSKSYKLVNQNWLGYDFMIENVWRRNIGLKPRNTYLYDQPYKVYDTLALSRAIKKQVKPDTSSSDAFLAWQYKMLSIRERLRCGLGAIGKELGINFDESALHNAQNDTLLNAEVFRKQVWALELI